MVNGAGWHAMSLRRAWTKGATDMVNGAGWHALRAAEGRGASRRVARPESSKGVDERSH